jgi:hypothetical protein
VVELWVRDPRIGGLLPNPLASAREWEGILVHEQVHVRQYERYPSCELAEAAWRTALADSTLALEGEAYCEQAGVFLRDGVFSPAELRGRVLLRMLARSPTKTLPEAFAVLKRVCPALME